MDDVPLALRNLAFLSALSPETRQLVVDSFVRASYPFGSELVRQGEPADAFYVLVSGNARVIAESDRGEEIPLNSLRPGDSFGEIALLEGSGRTATVRASSDVEVLRLDRSIFDAIVRAHPDVRRSFELQITHRRLHGFFRHYTPFARLPPDALSLMLAELVAVQADPGELVIREGAAPGPMYFVEEGRLRVFTERDGERRYLAYLRRGDFFGEMSLFKKVPRSASVEAATSCRLLMLTERTFEHLVETCPDFRTQLEERIAQYDYKHVARVPLDFDEELLPADVPTHPAVGPGQAAEVDPSAAPFETSEGFFVKKARRIRGFPFVRQLDEVDCGATSLAMVCRYFGRSVSLARVRQLTHTSIDGTSLRGLCAAATTLGLAARSVKASASTLSQMPLPAVVHWDGNHWVVLYDVDARHVRVADPAIGLRRLPRAEFDTRWTGYAALFDYTENFRQAPEGGASTAWFWPFLRPFRSVLAQAVGLAVVLSALQLVLPVFTQIIVDRVLVDQDVGLLSALMLSMLVVLVVMTVALVVQRYLLSFAAVRIDGATLDFLTRTLLALPMTYFSRRRTGDIQRRLAGMRQVREFVVQHGVTGLTAAVQLVAALALMVFYSPILAGVFLLVAPLYALLMRFSAVRLRPIFHTLEEGYARYASHQIDAIKGIETVKALGAEGAFRELMLDRFHHLARRQFTADFTMMCYEGVVGAVTLLSTVLFLWVGAYQVLGGRITIGALVAFNSLVALVNMPIATLFDLWDNLQIASVLLGRLQDVFEHEPEQGRDRSHLRPVRTLEGHVSVRNLGFRYGGPESQPILEGITFEAPPGKVVAIVGSERLGQDDARQVSGGVARADGGRHYLRPRGPSGARLPRPPPPDRLCPSGDAPLRRHHRPQHRLRGGGGGYGPCAVGCPCRQRPRVR